MAHPCVALLLGITIATALYYMFTSGETENQEPHNNNGHRSTNTNTSYEPTKRWSPDNRNDRSRRRRVEDSTCSICIDTSMQGKKITLQPCGHVFHKECIDQWIRVPMQQWCPNCRGPVLYKRQN